MGRTDDDLGAGVRDADLAARVALRRESAREELAQLGAGGGEVRVWSAVAISSEGRGEERGSLEDTLATAQHRDGGCDDQQDTLGNLQRVARAR